MNIKEVYEKIKQFNPSDLSALKMNDGKRHVFFVSPQLTSEGIYKMILPCLEFNKTGKFHCVMNNIIDHNPYKKPEPVENELYPDAIRWADVFVFGFTTEDLTEVFAQIHAINPACKIYYNIDYDFTKIPNTHPDYDQVKKNYNIIIENIKACDVILYGNRELIPFLKNGLKDDFNTDGIKISYIPGLVSDSFHNRKEIVPEPDKKNIRIGIVANPSHFDDLATLKRPLDTLLAQHKNMEIHLIGWNGKKKGNQKALKGIKYTHTPHVSALDYIETIRGLNIDIALIPNKYTPFNGASKNYYKYLELSTLGIPVITCDLPPFNTLILQKDLRKN